MVDKTTFMRENIEELEAKVKQQTMIIDKQQDTISHLDKVVDQFKSKVALFDDMTKKVKVRNPSPHTLDVSDALAPAIHLIVGRACLPRSRCRTWRRPSTPRRRR
jgi:uncharacterized coiled-coil protein SlyX